MKTKNILCIGLMPFVWAFGNCGLSPVTNSIGPISTPVTFVMDENSKENSVIEYRNSSRFRTVHYDGNRRVLVVTDAANPRLLEYDLTKNAWNAAKFNGPNGVQCIEFRNKSVGYLIDANGDFWSTDDSGFSWNKLPLKYEMTKIFREVDHLVLVSDSHFYLNSSFGLVETVDGGVTWSIVNRFRGLTVADVTFVDPFNGVIAIPREEVRLETGIAQRYELFRTENGGAGWRRSSTLTRLDGVRTIKFKDEFTGLLFGSYRPPSVTTNGGETWAPFDTGVARFIPISAEWVGESTVFLSGYQSVTDTIDFPRNGKSVLLRSDDGGVSYSIAFSDPNEPFFADMKTLGNDNIWLIGRDRLYRSIDNGRTWKLELDLRDKQVYYPQ